MLCRYDGKQKTLAFGKYPDFSLTEARRRGDEAKELLALGVDPSQHAKLERIRKSESNAATFEGKGIPADITALNTILLKNSEIAKSYIFAIEVMYLKPPLNLLALTHGYIRITIIGNWLSPRSKFPKPSL